MSVSLFNQEADSGKKAPHPTLCPRRGEKSPSPYPLPRESHHGGFATRKLMKIATPRFVAGLTGVIPGFWEGIFEVGEKRPISQERAAQNQKAKGKRIPSPGGEGRVRGFFSAWGNRTTKGNRPQENVWISDVQNAASGVVSYAWSFSRAGIHPRVLLRKPRKELFYEEGSGGKTVRPEGQSGMVRAPGSRNDAEVGGRIRGADV